MWTGTVDSIHIAPAAKAATQTVDAVEAVPGAGLKGDRYFLKQGTFSKPEPDFELTLIEAEAIEAVAREYKVLLAPSEARRNVVTRGVPLNHLVGRDFAIGEVRVAEFASANRVATFRRSLDSRSSKRCVTVAGCGRKS